MGIRALSFLLIFVLFSLSAFTEVKEKSLYFQSLIKYERFQFGEKEYQRIFRLIPKIKTSEKFQLIALLSRYNRELRDDPVESLKLLSLFILNSKGNWIQKYGEAKKRALLQWNKKVQEAKKNKDSLPEDPKDLFLEFPEITTWIVNYKTAPCLIEVALSLSSLNKTNDALSVIDKTGQKIENGYFRCIALEGAADIFHRNKLLEKSLKFYKNSLSFLKFDKSTEGLSELEEYTKKRIQKKINTLQRLIDIEKYGKGFVDYRKARSSHLKSNALLEAVLLYENLSKEYQSTVYDEAAKIYKQLTYLDLSKPSATKSIQKSLNDAEKRISNLEKEYFQARKAQLPKVTLENMKFKIAKAKEFFKSLKRIPTGNQALASCIDHAEELLKENKYGLYRGELLTEIGKYFLLEKMDSKNSIPWLTKADNWFNSVRDVDQSLDSFEVPTKAKKVAAPPVNERKMDNFGNIIKENVSIEKIFNRRTSSWYLNHFHKTTILYLGFHLFADKDYEKAKETWLRLHKIDPYFKESERRNHGSMVARLIWNCNNNQGALYATPEEFKHFTNKKLKLAVLLADLDYESENHKEAYEKYIKIEAEEYGKLSKNQAAYINYAIAATELYGQISNKSWKSRLLKFKDEYANTPSELRGLSAAAAVLACNPGNEKNFPIGIELYKHILNKFPNTDKGEDALFRLGSIYGSSGDPEKCKLYITLYLKKYPEGRWLEHANYLVKKNYDDSDWWKE